MRYPIKSLFVGVSVSIPFYIGGKLISQLDWVDPFFVAYLAGAFAAIADRVVQDIMKGE